MIINAIHLYSKELDTKNYKTVCTSYASTHIRSKEDDTENPER